MPIPLREIAAADGYAPFVAQVTGALQAAIKAVCREDAATPDHRVRSKFAEKAQLTLGAFAVAVAIAVAENLPERYSSLEDVTDEDVRASLNDLFTQVAFEVILPA